MEERLIRADAKVVSKVDRASGKVDAKLAKADAKVTSKMGRAAEKIEMVASKVDTALAREVEKQERIARRSTEKAEAIDRIAGTIGGLGIWTRIEPKGRRPRFSRDEIATAAIRIADEEGLDALSMRYLASELGAGTMTLYHYVQTKDELMALVSDTIMGEVVLPEGETLPADWRAAISVLAVRSRDAMARHPWVLDISDDPPFGPNGVRHFDESLEAVASLPIPLADRLAIISLVDEYVFGYCFSHRNAIDDGPDVFPPPVRAYVESLLGTGEYPQIQALADELGLDESWSQIAAATRDPARFERGLGLVLDGIEAWLAAGR